MKKFISEYRFVLFFLLIMQGQVFSQNAAINFDGVDDYVSTTYGGISGSSARSIEAWIKTTANTVPTAGGVQGVITDYGTFATGARFTFCVLWGNAIRIEVGGSGLSGSIVVNDGQWHHVACIYDPTAIDKYSLYVDGFLDIAGNITTAINTGSVNDFRIGQRVDNVNEFDGEIDEVRFFDYARTSAQIIADMNSEFCTIPTGLEAYYRFNDGTINGVNTGNTTTLDESGNLNNGTLTNFGLTGTTSNWVNGSSVATGLNGSTLIINTCSAYTSTGGIVYTASGIYNETYTNSVGCDSILILDITIAPLTGSINVVACDSYTSPSGLYTWTGDGYYQDTVQSSSGCDSVINITLDIANYQSTTFVSDCGTYTTPDGNNTWSVSGSYPITYTGVAGCDSIIIYDVTINNSSISAITIASCGPYTAPSGNTVWSSSGIYTDVMSNALGCDSTITINLTVTIIDISVVQNNATLTSNMVGAQYQWNNCIGTGGVITPILGATNQSFTTAVNGDFSVTVSQNGCEKTSSCYAIDFIGLEESSMASSEIYPNPTNGEFTILLGGDEKEVSVELFDIKGKVIYTSNQKNIGSITVDMDLPRGIYFVRLRTDQNTTIHQVVVN